MDHDVSTDDPLPVRRTANGFSQFAFSFIRSRMSKDCF